MKKRGLANLNFFNVDFATDHTSDSLIELQAGFKKHNKEEIGSTHIQVKVLKTKLRSLQQSSI